MSLKERGALLTVWLVLMLTANAVTVLLYSAFTISSVGRSLFLPGVPAWAIYVFISLGALNTACVCFLFLWKKWAFWGLCASAGIVLAINLYIGVGVFAFLGLAGVVILYLVIRPKWKMLDNF
jgi:hypothetical protein